MYCILELTKSFEIQYDLLSKLIMLCYKSFEKENAQIANPVKSCFARLVHFCISCVTIVARHTRRMSMWARPSQKCHRFCTQCVPINIHVARCQLRKERKKERKKEREPETMEMIAKDEQAHEHAHPKSKCSNYILSHVYSGRSP